MVSATPPQPPARRGPRRGLVVALAVVLGTAVGVGAYVLLEGDGGAAGAPEQAVRDYLTAQADHDCERLVALLSERIVEEDGGRRESLDSCEDSRTEDEDEVADEDLASLLGTVETAGVDGDRATVTYTASAEIVGELDPVTIEVTLVREDGAWRVDGSAPVSGELPDDAPQAAARDHAQAILDGDCAAYLAVLSEGALAELGDTPDSRSAGCERRIGSGPSVADPRLGPVVRDSEDDGAAVVGVTIFSESYEAGNNIFYVAVVEENGVWKVDQLDWSSFPEDTAG